MQQGNGMNHLIVIVDDFVTGLLKYAKVNHAGNCLAVSEILRGYLNLFNINTCLINVIVNEDDNDINHYCLQTPNGTIIDATASQFKGMPKIFIGDMPANYFKNNNFKP